MRPQAGRPGSQGEGEREEARGRRRARQLEETCWDALCGLGQV